MNNNGGLGYSATRRGGKVSGDFFTGKTTGCAQACGWTRITSRPAHYRGRWASATTAEHDPTSPSNFRMARYTLKERV